MAKLPLPDGLNALAQWDDRIRDTRRQGLYFATTTTLANSAKTLARFAASVGSLRTSEIALAVERYRLAHAAALPGTLTALVSQYLAAVPHDPFDGKPIRYKKISPKGYRVYSIGPDRRDDGGIELKTEIPSDGKYDLVFTFGR